MIIINLLFAIVLFFHVTKAAQGFIFSTDDSEKTSLLTWEYDDKCARNQTIRALADEIRTKYRKIDTLSRGELRFVRRQGFRTVFQEICEKKRNMVRTMTDWIQPVADFCFADERIRKELVLNTLLLVEFNLDFFCGMNQSHYVDIYERQSPRCFEHNSERLKTCQKNSFDLYFWEKVPDPPTLLQLLNGSVCNFAFDKLLSCAFDVIESSRSCSEGARDLLSYEIEVIKRNSLCFKTKDVSELIDSSSENLSNIVS